MKHFRRTLPACLPALWMSGALLAQSGTPGTGEVPPPMPPVALDQAMQGGPRGTLAVRALQGTKGGPEVNGGEVEIVLFHRDQPIKQIKSALDEHGVLMIGDLPVAMGVRPLVRIKHAGVLYQDAGPEMSAQKQTATVMVTVYETTDETPAWRVLERHVATARIDGGLQVGETLVVENTGDRTWLGAAADADGRRTTVTTMLPKEAADVQLGPGFHGWCCTSLADDRLSIQMPLMPGRMTYQFAYHLPEVDGKVGLLLTNTVKTDRVSIFVPDDGSAAQTTLVRAGPTDRSGPSPLRMFQADNVSAGQAVGVVLAQAPAVPAVAAQPKTGVSTKVWAGAAAGVVAVAGIGLALFRRRSSSRLA